VEAACRKRWSQCLVLFAAQLGHEPAPGPQQTGRRNNDPADHVEPVGAAIESEAGFVTLDIRRQEAQLHRWNVGRDRGDEVEAPAADRLVEVSDERVYAVASGAHRGSYIYVDTDDRGRWHLSHEVGGDGAGAGAKVDSPAAIGPENCGRPPGQLLALGSRDIDAPFDAERTSAELHAADDPGEGFALSTTANPHLECVLVRCGSDELFRLFLGGNATGRRKACRDSWRRTKDRHATV
jgi:hypothetical protein